MAQNQSVNQQSTYNPNESKDDPFASNANLSKLNLLDFQWHEECFFCDYCQKVPRINRFVCIDWKTRVYTFCNRACKRQYFKLKSK